MDLTKTTVKTEERSIANIPPKVQNPREGLFAGCVHHIQEKKPACAR